MQGHSITVEVGAGLGCRSRSGMMWQFAARAGTLACADYVDGVTVTGHRLSRVWNIKARVSCWPKHCSIDGPFSRMPVWHTGMSIRVSKAAGK